MLNASLIGNLGGDPDLQYSASGSAFLRLNVATNGRVRTQAGEWEDRTEWVRVTVFGQRAESLSTLLKKGTRVYVSGRLEARPWTGKDGQEKAGLEVVAETVEFMSSRQDDDAPRQQPARAARPAAAAAVHDELEGLDGLPF